MDGSVSCNRLVDELTRDSEFSSPKYYNVLYLAHLYNVSHGRIYVNYLR